MTLEASTENVEYVESLSHDSTVEFNNINTMHRRPESLLCIRRQVGQSPAITQVCNV